ncbi:PfkB family carbohydrate kinase [Micromonospora sp. NPDC050686]|uniref:PfkB family carbohydrate kinase n=1 Tax=Micromonospora sp. NPDC050686 TaxID=3154631 RepID=UPI0033F9F8CB
MSGVIGLLRRQRVLPVLRLPSAAGAHTRLLARVPDDELGDELVAQVAGGQRIEVPTYPAGRVVDQTGAGDVLAGTVAARLALGDGLPDAVRLSAAAAALSRRGHRGTGCLPLLAESRRLVARGGAEVSG